MSNLHVKYLLVGGGVASWSAARAIRARDADGSMVLVGQEINRPYHRPPLSKAWLRRQMPREALFAADAGWFEQHRVDLRTHRRVSHLDVHRQAAFLDDGKEVSWDKLLLATGASPAPLGVPGSNLPNLFSLRTLDDDVQLHNATEKARREGRPHAGGRGRVTIIGAGRLGVELAGSLTQMGLAVDLLAAPGHPWHRFAGEATGRLLTRYLERHGVTVHVGTFPLRLEGDGRVQRVALDAGRSIDCDFAVAALGSLPNKDLLRGTPITAEKAILVDDHGRTNLPDVYAAGDCCAIYDARFGKYRWVDQWDHAQVTGALAGNNMAGGDEAYAAVSSFTTEVFDLAVTVWGEARLVDRRIVRGTPNADNPDWIEIGVAADSRIAQVIAVGHRGDDATLRDLVARRLPVDGNQEQLKDPAVSLAALLQ